MRFPRSLRSRLFPGRYRLVAVAFSPQGSSSPVRTTFTVSSPI